MSDDFLTEELLELWGSLSEDKKEVLLAQAREIIVRRGLSRSSEVLCDLQGSSSPIG